MQWLIEMCSENSLVNKGMQTGLVSTCSMLVVANINIIVAMLKQRVLSGGDLIKQQEVRCEIQDSTMQSDLLTPRPTSHTHKCRWIESGAQSR